MNSKEELREVEGPTGLCLLKMNKSKDEWKLYRILTDDNQRTPKLFDGNRIERISFAYYVNNGLIRYVEDDGTKLVYTRQEEKPKETPTITAKKTAVNSQRKNIKQAKSNNNANIHKTEDKDKETQPTNECYEYLKKERGVKYLIHFTPVDNVESIMREGILPREMQETPGIYTDDIRLDNQLDASDFSISFPNYLMFYRKWKIEKKYKFAVLLIDIDILRYIDPEKMIFYSHNAAAAEMQQKSNEDKHGLEALKELFKDNEDEVRVKYFLPRNYTTNPQAEIQIRDRIPPEAIKTIHVNESEAFISLYEKGISGKTTIVVSDTYFSPRRDYKYWSPEKKDDNDKTVTDDDDLYNFIQ